ncbi:hypothetical protein ACH5RR_032378 [Cinchona calisaya]|uniref:Uncharacterized protein n=1 Tax=Cinchona calisaya TaxID=153742 RepID=A0ABD2YJV9_9GENT
MVYVLNFIMIDEFLLRLSFSDASAFLTALFKDVGSTEERSAKELSSWENVREKILCFIEEKNLQDVTTVEFRMFVDFLKIFSLFKTECFSSIQCFRLLLGSLDLVEKFCFRSMHINETEAYSFLKHGLSRYLQIPCIFAVAVSPTYTFKTSSYRLRYMVIRYYHYFIVSTAPSIFSTSISWNWWK